MDGLVLPTPPPVKRPTSPSYAAAFGHDWRRDSWLALDFETTGLDPHRERVVEIGALRWSDGQETATFSSLVKPGIHIPSVVVAIHGIRDKDVSSSPRFLDIGAVLMAMAEGATIVAHNAPFDLAFLRMELAKAGLPSPENRVLDTRLLAKAAWPGLSSYRLVDLAARFGIDTGRSHRALDDARACLGLLLLCAQRLAPRGS